MCNRVKMKTIRRRKFHSSWIINTVSFVLTIFENQTTIRMQKMFFQKIFRSFQTVENLSWKAAKRVNKSFSYVAVLKFKNSLALF